MKPYALQIAVLVSLLITASGGHASHFTPLAWQQPVERHGVQAVVGQRKHTTWIRDQNRNFIDDLIEERHEVGELVDVVVDLNTCLPFERMQDVLGPFGVIRYPGKLITFVMLDDVRFERIETLASLPEVAMVEIQITGEVMTDVSTRAVQSNPSVTYSPGTAADAGFTGAGVTVAIMDTGVDDGHDQFTGKFVAGFNALVFEDTNLNGIDDSCEPAPLGNGVCTDADDEPADGSTNPDDDQSHGTHVAGIAIGQGAAGVVCSTPDDGSTPTNCGGVAPDANLVDVKICDSGGSCSAADVAEGLDWLGLNAGAMGVRVVNMSIGFCADDDGTSAMAQQVNYLASLGVVMAVAHGNASNCGLAAGTVRTMYPGSASFAITVGGTNDRDTVSRTDETNYSSFLQGPRNDFNVASPDLIALKPDISAPGQSINAAQYNSSSSYSSKSGTSMAAPHVAGAAAVVLEVQPTMDPGSVKDLLKRSADASLNTAAFPAIDPQWDTAYGSGMLDLWTAVSAVAATDVGFPTCSGPPSSSGKPCALSGGLPSWNNSADIDTTSPPQVGVPTNIAADVENFGAANATVLVSFGVYVFAAGNNEFFHVGTQQVTVPAGTAVTVFQPWTPISSSHQCVQVAVEYGFDTNFDNNVTQRNLSVAPSVFTVQVENPFPVPADFEIRAKSQRDDWKIQIDVERFRLHPFRDCPRQIEVTFDPPPDAKVGERANGDIAVFARPEGGDKLVLIGGVTVQTFVPRPCRAIGWIRDDRGRPVDRAKVRVTGERVPAEAVSDKDGVVSLEVTPYRLQTMVVETEEFGRHRAQVRLYCGVGSFEIVVSKKGIKITTRQREEDWHWDQQLRDGDKDTDRPEKRDEP